MIGSSPSCYLVGPGNGHPSHHELAREGRRRARKVGNWWGERQGTELAVDANDESFFDETGEPVGSLSDVLGPIFLAGLMLDEQGWVVSRPPAA